MKKKIGLIGGGQIGGNLALLAVQKGRGHDVVLYDIPQAEGLVKAQGAGHQSAHGGGWLGLQSHGDHGLEGRGGEPTS